MMARVPRRPRADNAAIVDSRGSVTASRRKAANRAVVGFGCPAIDWPHYVCVEIPASRGGDIVIIEDFGIAGYGRRDAEQAQRCVLPRPRWSAIADVLRREFNERLRALSLPSGRWQTGINKIERMLGQELLALAWSVSVAEPVELAAVIASWQALRPAERWWLAARVAANPAPRAIQGLAMLLSVGPLAVEAVEQLAAPTALSEPRRIMDKSTVVLRRRGTLTDGPSGH